MRDKKNTEKRAIPGSCRTIALGAILGAIPGAILGVIVIFWIDLFDLLTALLGDGSLFLAVLVVAGIQLIVGVIIGAVAGGTLGAIFGSILGAILGSNS